MASLLIFMDVSIFAFSGDPAPEFIIPAAGPRKA
jgi:hypothetical protein